MHSHVWCVQMPKHALYISQWNPCWRSCFTRVHRGHTYETCVPSTQYLWWLVISTQGDSDPIDTWGSVLTLPRHSMKNSYPECAWTGPQSKCKYKIEKCSRSPVCIPLLVSILRNSAMQMSDLILLLTYLSLPCHGGPYSQTINQNKLFFLLLVRFLVTQQWANWWTQPFP